MRRFVCALAAAGAVVMSRGSEEKKFPVAGADEDTVSRTQYFSWINNTNEGSTEKQTLINLDFFRWLKNEYGMRLDIYAWDAGNIDGSKEYGSTRSARFKEYYPNGWQPIYESAKSIGCRLGIWGGPDGFGSTPEESAERIDMISELCRKYEFALFKFDAVCGNLRPEKQDDFITLMQTCRKYSPDLILLNHRLRLGKGLPYATTFLWGGEETYIDVHMYNQVPAPHHRAGALTRGLPPNLTRMTEDHGVCISSCIDRWDDDLVLQAFNRSLILAPQIYGNPWLMRDDEFPKLARIYNLHRGYGAILTKGIVLPESYGTNAVSRGDAKTRFITLRNLTWNTVPRGIKLDSEIGFEGAEAEVRLLHPFERVLGRFKRGEVVTVDTEPFRSALVMVSEAPIKEPGVSGCDAEVVRDVPGKPVLLKLRGLPGETAQIKLYPGARESADVRLNGKSMKELAKGESVAVRFPGEKLKQPYHRKLGDLEACPVPADAEAIFEATCFAADNDALELRELRRSGETKIPQVEAARDAFFGQDYFVRRGCDGSVLFDGNPNTAFAVQPDPYRGSPEPETPTAKLRVDFGKVIRADKITIRINGGTGIGPAEVSADLVNWVKVAPEYVPGAVYLRPASDKPFRHLRMTRGTLVPSEVEASLAGRTLARDGWRASNLFPAYADVAASAAWKTTVTVPEAAKGSYLCIALEGEHGPEGAWVGAKAAGVYAGCPDRASSFRCNPWECRVKAAKTGYTYYLPLTAEMIGKPIELYALTLKDGVNNYKPAVWVTSLDPRETLELEIR